jgi:hypothetical protein
MNMDMRRRVNSLSEHHRGRVDRYRGKQAAQLQGLIHTLIILVLIGIIPVTAWAAEGRGYLDVTGGYKTGSFGTPTKSELFYFSPALGYVTPGYDASITIPYLFQSNTTAGQATTEDGIGDVLLHGGLVFLPETKDGYSLYGSASIKLPTADKEKGLGTGETDIGGFLSAGKRIDDNRFTLSAGYIIVGSPAGVNFNNVYVFDFGYARIFSLTELLAWYEQRGAMVSGAKDPQEINVGFFHILNRDYSIKGSTFVGLNNGGPDFGLNLGIVRWF